MFSDLKAGEFSQVQEMWHEGDPWARKPRCADLLWGRWALAASQGQNLDRAGCEGQGQDISGIPWNVHSMGLTCLTWRLWTQREPEKGPLGRSPGGGLVVACVCVHMHHCRWGFHGFSEKNILNSSGGATTRASGLFKITCDPSTS